MGHKGGKALWRETAARAPAVSQNKGTHQDVVVHDNDGDGTGRHDLGQAEGVVAKALDHQAKAGTWKGWRGEAGHSAAAGKSTKDVRLRVARRPSTHRGPSLCRSTC